MNTEAIYKMSEEINEEKVNEILSEWEKNGEKEKIRLYNSLVNLGDSKELACATVYLKEPISQETIESYRFAYEN